MMTIEWTPPLIGGRTTPNKIFARAKQFFLVSLINETKKIISFLVVDGISQFFVVRWFSMMPSVDTDDVNDFF